MAIYTLATSFFVGSALGPASVSMATLYRCIDQTGRSVFTDRTAQMTQCAPLSVEALQHLFFFTHQLLFLPPPLPQNLP